MARLKNAHRMQGGLRPSKKTWPRQPTTNKYKKHKYKSEPLKNMESMLAMWTSTNIKKKQTYPNDSFAHRRWNLPFFFAHARIAASVFVMAEASAKASVVFGCLLLFHFSGLIKIDCKQHIPLLFSLWPGCPVLWWRVPLKDEVLPPDTMGFEWLWWIF